MVPEDAIEVSYARTELSESASYALRRTYPAGELLEEIERTLDRLEWSPAEERRAQSEVPGGYEAGWMEWVDATVDPPQRVQSWHAKWHDRDDNTLTYQLRYMGDDRGLVHVWIQRLTPEFQRISDSLRAVVLPQVMAEARKAQESSRPALTQGEADYLAGDAGEETLSSDYLVVRPVYRGSSETADDRATFDGRTYYYDKSETLLTDEHFRRDGVSVFELQTKDGTGLGRMGVEVLLTREGSHRLEEWTAAHLEEFLGTFLGGELQEAARVKGPLNREIIIWDLSEEEAEAVQERLLGPSPGLRYPGTPLADGK
ncbi:MAG: hypothetical protein OES32_06960 [Acidobacteriota bacterium]|nr:hypothetical protein [Acidobacteriota bacterium]